MYLKEKKKAKKKKNPVFEWTLNLSPTIWHKFDKGTKDILIDLVRNLDKRLYLTFMAVRKKVGKKLIIK